jgi:hypothetical protein
MSGTSLASSSGSSSVVSSNPTRGLQPTKSALKSSRRATVDREGDNTTRYMNPAPGPMSGVGLVLSGAAGGEEHPRYFSSDLQSPRLPCPPIDVQRDVKQPSHVELDHQQIVTEDEGEGEEDDDDDDEIDTGAFYGLEEERDPPVQQDGDDLEAVWDDDDDDGSDNDESEKDATRKSSFSVVSSLKDLLEDHRDSAALMKLMGLSQGDDLEAKPR